MVGDSAYPWGNRVHVYVLPSNVNANQYWLSGCTGTLKRMHSLGRPLKRNVYHLEFVTTMCRGSVPLAPASYGGVYSLKILNKVPFYWFPWSAESVPGSFQMVLLPLPPTES